MAGLAGREVGVVEVEVADERAVVERGAVGRGPAAADQGAERAAAEVVELGADRSDGRRVERAERAAERVEDADLQLFARGARRGRPTTARRRSAPAAQPPSSRAPDLSAGSPRARPRRCARCRAPRRRASAFPRVRARAAPAASPRAPPAPRCSDAGTRRSGPGRGRTIAAARCSARARAPTRPGALLARDAARPDPVDQDAVAVGGRGRLVGALETHVHS